MANEIGTLTHTVSIAAFAGARDLMPASNSVTESNTASTAAVPDPNGAIGAFGASDDGLSCLGLLGTPWEASAQPPVVVCAQSQAIRRVVFSSIAGAMAFKRRLVRLILTQCSFLHEGFAERP